MYTLYVFNKNFQSLSMTKLDKSPKDKYKKKAVLILVCTYLSVYLCVHII